MTNLTLGGTDNGTLAGSGQAQLFAVNVPSTQSLIVTLQDSTATDVNQLYAKLGSPPTPVNYRCSSSGAGSANPQLLVPSAAPGTWYILVYAASVPSSSTFTIQAVGTRSSSSAVTPDQLGHGQPGHADPHGLGVRRHDDGQPGLGRATRSTRPPRCRSTR